MKRIYFVTVLALFLCCGFQHSNKGVSLFNNDLYTSTKEDSIAGTFINESYCACIVRNNLFQNCSDNNIKAITISEGTINIFQYSFTETSYSISENRYLLDEDKKVVGKIIDVKKDGIKIQHLGKEINFRKISTNIYEFPINYYINSEKIQGIYILSSTNKKVELKSSGEIDIPIYGDEEIYYKGYQIEVDFNENEKTTKNYNTIYLINNDNNRREFAFEFKGDTLDIFNKSWTGNSVIDRKRTKNDVSVFKLIKKKE